MKEQIEKNLGLPSKTFSAEDLLLALAFTFKNYIPLTFLVLWPYLYVFFSDGDEIILTFFGDGVAAFPSLVFSESTRY